MAEYTLHSRGILGNKTLTLPAEWQGLIEAFTGLGELWDDHYYSSDEDIDEITKRIEDAAYNQFAKKWEDNEHSAALFSAFKQLATYLNLVLKMSPICDEVIYAKSEHTVLDAVERFAERAGIEITTTKIQESDDD